jgi:hypothetical protein
MKSIFIKRVMLLQGLSEQKNMYAEFFIVLIQWPNYNVITELQEQCTEMIVRSLWAINILFLRR